MPKKPLIVGFGELLWDLLPEGKQLGGAPGNFAYHASRQGGRGVVVSSVGDDPLGQEIIELLTTQLGLTTEQIAIDTEHPTGTVSIELDDHGKPTYEIHLPVAWDFIPNRPELIELAKEADVVCFGTLAQRLPTSRATLQAFLDQVPNESLKIFDINLRQTYFDLDCITTGLEAANILKLNNEELPIVARMFSLLPSEEVSAEEEKEETEIATLRALLDRFHLDLIALTKGSEGAMLITPSEIVTHQGIPVNVIDTVGAGDSFTAALAMGLLEHLDLKTIIARASQVAAFVCASHGAVPNY